MSLCQLLAVVLFLSLVSSTSNAAPAPVNSITMKVVNHGGAPIELFWVDTFTRRGQEGLVKQTSKPIRNNTDATINSYDTHVFAAKFLKSVPGVSKQPEARFVKGPQEETVFVTYDPVTNTMQARQTTKLNEIMDTVNEAIISCGDSEGDELSACIASAVMDDVAAITDSKARLTQYRDLIASRLRNYTCADTTMNTSAIERSYDHVLPDGKRITYNILMDTQHAKIWTVDDFISEEECAVLEAHGRPRLRTATIAAEDGSSIVSEHRKAQQAHYDTPRGPADKLWHLYNRVLETTNRHTGYNLKPAGQEGFTIIQYNVADQYTPHCDGTCDGSMHIPAGRIATAVMYCRVAEEGGGTTFTKADIFVKPKVGHATFFSYKGLDGRMDDGYTEHSGCPVTKGEKWITTAWMRDGVDDHRPWNLFDPDGNLLLDESYAGGDDDKADGGHGEL